MRDNVTIVRERQLAIRRELDRRSIALKVIALDSGIGYDTLLSYFPNPDGAREPAQIGGAAIYSLCGAVAAGSMPADLLSLLLPAGFQIVRAPEGIDHDALCELASDYVAEKNRAHHPESEAGRDIGPSEAVRLSRKAINLVGSIAA